MCFKNDSTWLQTEWEIDKNLHYTLFQPLKAMCVSAAFNEDIPLFPILASKVTAALCKGVEKNSPGNFLTSF